MDTNYLKEMNKTRNKMVRRLTTLQNNFGCIDGIYLLASQELPKQFQDKMNIVVSFKALSVLSYYKHALLNKEECLMHFWRPSGIKNTWRRTKFWSLQTSRLLLALSRIHCQSEILAIWIWADTRIISIEFFCKTPAKMIQARPQKILRIS